MLISLSDRGPDSAASPSTARLRNEAKITIQSAKPERDFRGLDTELAKAIGTPVSIAVKSTHAVVRTTPAKIDEAREAIQALRPDIRIMGAGDVVEIYKEVGCRRRWSTVSTSAA